MLDPFAHQDAAARWTRRATRMAVAAIVVLVGTIVLGMLGWQGLTGLAFLLALVLAVSSGGCFAVAAYHLRMR